MDKIKEPKGSFLFSMVLFYTKLYKEVAKFHKEMSVSIPLNKKSPLGLLKNLCRLYNGAGPLHNAAFQVKCIFKTKLAHYIAGIAATGAATAVYIIGFGFVKLLYIVYKALAFVIIYMYGSGYNALAPFFRCANIKYNSIAVFLCLLPPLLLV
jgi:hypothetical protein